VFRDEKRSRISGQRGLTRVLALKHGRVGRKQLTVIGRAPGFDFKQALRFFNHSQVADTKSVFVADDPQAYRHILAFGFFLQEAHYLLLPGVWN